MLKEPRVQLKSGLNRTKRIPTSVPTTQPQSSKVSCAAGPARPDGELKRNRRADKCSADRCGVRTAIRSASWACSTHVEPGNAAAEHRMPAWRPLAFAVEAMVGINSLHVADSKSALSAPPNSKNDPKWARAGTADGSCFPPCFFSVICFCRN